MPLILPEGLLDDSALAEEGIETLDSKHQTLHSKNERTGSKKSPQQAIRPLKVAIVNLMPNKEETERQFLKVLSDPILPVQIDLVRVVSHEAKNASQGHLDQFYKSLAEIRQDKYDGMLFTGAPLELLDYNEIDYWSELKDLFDFARENVYSTMFICWSAQAALYYYYGIKNSIVGQKIFGIFDYEKREDNQLVEGLDKTFSAPHSRWSCINEGEVASHPELKILASRPDTGVSIVTNQDSRQVFSFGHWEYNIDTLHKEYERDLSEHKDIQLPKNYYTDNSHQSIKSGWKKSGKVFFSNWLHHVLYQGSPYDLEKITEDLQAKVADYKTYDSQFKQANENS
ncbi:homoserine O-succinyltransferase [Alloiococcus otitis]|uniref:homoserine O-succinyltransferase n=1 Tax=Alloiococcus otitis TaxID=1652 RepID=UPI0023540D9E|nr:homoserine O-succinyltransferase [Alloiococcus otitis]